MTSKKLIYALCDPRTHEVRYIGRSSSGMERPKSHLRPSRLKEESYKVNWIKSLLAQGLKPTIQILHEFQDDATNEQLNHGEMWCIAHYKLCGYKLTNATDGGEGLLNPSDFIRSKLSKAHKGKRFSVEHKAKISESTKLSNTRKGKKLSEDHRAKMSKSAQNRPAISPETRSRMRAAQANRSPETRILLSEAAKKRWAEHNRTQTSLAEHFESN